VIGVSLLVRVGQVLLDVLFPPRCAACGAYGAFLCERCRQELPRARPPRCPVCWEAQVRGVQCARCRAERPTFAGVRSPYLYQGPARELVHALKYNYVSALARPMGALMADYLAEEETMEADLLVPVPLYGRRRRVRGYNQSALLTRELGRICGLPADERALSRRRDTLPQARSADAEARRRNVADAFSAERARVEGQRILVIDDVMTTGATLDACAHALRQAGATSVWALTFARED
jgi:competence protein ComFC